MAPLAAALQVMLELLRGAGGAQRVLAPGGQFQQSLPQGRTFQLLRVWLDPALDMVPEITGHRLLVSVRLMRADAEGRLRPSGLDTAFEMALCA
jgi:cell division protein ZapD